MRYLGVLLYCKSLVNKVHSRISNWKNKCLSYAGKLQLITSVLSSIQVYWMSVFELPISIIKELGSLFKDFLWNNGEKKKGGAKVAWKEICRPKDQEGLGLKIWESGMSYFYSNMCGIYYQEKIIFRWNG